VYKVKIEQFEGPFDLLLEIIESKKLPLVEVSLYEITEQFVEYLKNIDDRPIEELVRFLVIASRLAFLKSKELVPSEDEIDETEGDLNELERQLAIYKPFRDAAKELNKIDKNNGTFHARQSFAGFDNVFYFPKKLKITDISQSLEELLKTIILPQRIPQARLKDTESLKNCIDKLGKLVENDKKVNFSDIIDELESERKIINFLSLLELGRLGKIATSQKNNFGTIMINSLKIHG
jgi:segregation and condensation protein A